jgi:CheY-like chemotaxis protein
LASQHSFDLLVSDLGLPDGSGHELMRQLRSRGHAFPGIALSGYGQTGPVPLHVGQHQAIVEVTQVFHHALRRQYIAALGVQADGKPAGGQGFDLLPDGGVSASRP